MDAIPSLPVRLSVPITYDVAGTPYAQPVPASGLLRAEGGALVVEARPVTGAEATVQTIPLGDVSQVELRSSLFGTRLVLRPRRLDAFDGLHLSDGAAVLTVRRRDRALASRWATEISLALLDRDA